jgi:hypothetical protein
MLGTQPMESPISIKSGEFSTIFIFVGQVLFQKHNSIFLEQQLSLMLLTKFNSLADTPSCGRFRMENFL